MAKYLNPKADLTFKKVFGEQKDLLISFLNAMLPLDPEKQIVSLEYLTPELVPVNPDKKDTVVDVRCTDSVDRQFLVEMQMYWTPAFKKRTLVNTCKAYTRPMEKGTDYRDLKPIYTLSLVNDIAFPELPDEFYHEYVPMNKKHSDHAIDDFEMIFVELPKFTPSSVKDKKMMVLWLRFMTEINENTREVPAELAENEHIAKALSIVEESAYSDDELYVIDKYWDQVSRERTALGEAEDRGIAIGRAEGRAEGLAEGHKKGLAEGRKVGVRSMVHSLLSMGVLTDEQIVKAANITMNELYDIRESYEQE